MGNLQNSWGSAKVQLETLFNGLMFSLNSANVIVLYIKYYSENILWLWMDWILNDSSVYYFYHNSVLPGLNHRLYNK